jgi:protein-tyrosine phosphatase
MGNQIDKVLPGLYVGGFLGTDRKKKLQENKITHILAIHDNAEPEFTDLFTYKCIRVSDMSSSDLSVYFSECVDYIHSCRIKGGSVFVHCAAGISRSVTITVMYMMTVSEHSFEECLTAVRACREVANPNFGFRLQLQKYAEGKLKSERLRVLKEYPTTPSLGDNAAIERLLRVGREKEKGSSDGPFTTVRHGTLEGGRGGKDEEEEKAKDSSHDKKRSDLEVKCV